MIPVLYYILPTAVVLIILRKLCERSWGTCKNKVNLHGKVAIVTGANSGIGYETAKELARRGATVVFACRDLDKAVKAVFKVQKAVSTTAFMVPLQLNLESSKSIREFVGEVTDRFPQIHILVNNAGVYYPDKAKKRTEKGYEIHFAVNHSGHFLLTNLLVPNLSQSPPSRVIVVSSSLSRKGKINLEDLNSDKVGNKYENSKLANVYFAKELAKRMEGQGINVYTVFPGWVYTGLFRNIDKPWFFIVPVLPVAFFFMRTPKQGAQTTIYCATEPSLENQTGLIYRNCRVFQPSVAIDPDVSIKLWQASERMVQANT